MSRQTKELLKVDIVLRHPDIDPKLITEYLQLQPRFAWKQDSNGGPHMQQGSLWRSCLLKNSLPEMFPAALEQILGFLESHEHWFKDFRNQQGELDIVLQFSSQLGTGKMCELQFGPIFLAVIGNFCANLRIEFWVDD